MAQKTKVLIVDDDKSVLRILTRIFQKEGFDTETAETGKEAEEKINDATYDVGIIDVKLPDVDGTDLLSKIHSTNPTLVKIMLTGFPSVDNGIRATNMGADAYLVKPVQPEELLRIIKEKLKQRISKK